MDRRRQNSHLIQAAQFIRDGISWFLSKRRPRPWRRETAALARVGIGQCEAQGGAPRPPPQPTGPRGPLGPCPAHLAPWRAVQAPTTRPIGCWLGQRAWSAAADPIHYGTRTTHLRTQDGYGRSLRPLGSLGVAGVAWDTLPDARRLWIF